MERKQKQAKLYLELTNVSAVPSRTALSRNASRLAIGVLLSLYTVAFL